MGEAFIVRDRRILKKRAQPSRKKAPKWNTAAIGVKPREPITNNPFSFMSQEATKKGNRFPEKRYST
jgi:hypothetical protein